jgi:hypothetical protein
MRHIFLFFFSVISSSLSAQQYTFKQLIDQCRKIELTPNNNSPVDIWAYDSSSEEQQAYQIMYADTDSTIFAKIYDHPVATVQFGIEITSSFHQAYKFVDKLSRHELITIIQVEDTIYSARIQLLCYDGHITPAKSENINVSIRGSWTVVSLLLLSEIRTIMKRKI